MSYQEFADLRIPHPDYLDSDTANDVGLLRLPRAASGPEIALIAMAHRSLGSFAGELVQASGYGNINTTGPPSSHLLKADLMALSNDDCRRSLGNILGSHICAQWHMIPDQSVCPGDSGGPLTVQSSDGSRLLVGIANFISGDGCDSGAPAAFARVSSFRSWAETEMDNN